jgi:ubiquinone biosynthesis protein COQ9
MQAARAARWNVTFRLVPATEVHVPFAERGRPESPYRQAICELLKPEAEDKVLEFPEVKARYQLAKHARELKVKLLFAEEGGKLFVKLVKPAKVNHQILDFIRERPRTRAELESMVLNRKLELNLSAELQALSGEALIHLASDSKWYASKAATNGGSRS